VPALERGARAPRADAANPSLWTLSAPSGSGAAASRPGRDATAPAASGWQSTTGGSSGAGRRPAPSGPPTQGLGATLSGGSARTERSPGAAAWARFLPRGTPAASAGHGAGAAEDVLSIGPHASTSQLMGDTGAGDDLGSQRAPASSGSAQQGQGAGASRRAPAARAAGSGGGRGVPAQASQHAVMQARVGTDRGTVAAESGRCAADVHAGVQGAAGLHTAKACMGVVQHAASAGGAACSASQQGACDRSPGRGAEPGDPAEGRGGQAAPGLEARGAGAPAVLSEVQNLSSGARSAAGHSSPAAAKRARVGRMDAQDVAQLFDGMEEDECDLAALGLLTP
jgi:hypothetical protein